MNIRNPILPGFNPDPSIVRVEDGTPGQRYDFVFGVKPCDVPRTTLNCADI